MKIKGIIALDIDGTITQNPQNIPNSVALYLSDKAKNGWHLVFITGRSTTLAMDVLQRVNAPYDLSPQCGTALISMPEKKITYKSYLERKQLLLLEQLFQDTQEDFVAYGGFEDDDRCYYRPRHLPKEVLNYINDRLILLPGGWLAIEEPFSQQRSDYAMAKVFADEAVLIDLKKRIDSTELFYTQIVKDTYRPNHKLMQIMDRKVNKGLPIMTLKNRYHAPLPVIGAGDDYNDEALLLVSDIKIVMDHAPVSLKKMADIVADTHKEEGIIEALEEAIEQYG